MKVCRNCMVFFNDNIETCTKCGSPTTIVGENTAKNDIDKTSSEQYPYECPVCQKEYKQDSFCSCGLKTISKSSCNYSFVPIAIIVVAISIMSIIFSVSLIGYDSAITVISVGIEILLAVCLFIACRNYHKYKVRQQRILIQFIKNSKK